MEGQALQPVYRIQQADGAPAVTVNLDSIESIEYGGTGNESRCTVIFTSGLTKNFNRQIGQQIETAWQAWTQHQAASSGAQTLASGR
jgi:hypothetical protein